MTEWKHPTAYSAHGEEEREAIERVIRSGRFTQGEEVAAFERELAAFHGRKHAVMVNSGSSANLIAVAALSHVKHRPLKRGDKVIVPAVAWATTYAPLVQYGLDLVLADCDGSWNADLYGNLQSPEGVRLVVGCSILGSPANLPGWQSAAGVMDAYFINDDCESLGARIKGATTGSFGLMATESFFYSHQVSAIEGGAVLTDDDECDRLCRMLRAHGWTRDVEPAQAFEDEYQFEIMGYNLRGLEMHAAIAREQLKKLPGFVRARAENLEAFKWAVRGSPIDFQDHEGDPSPFGFSFRVGEAPARNQLVAAFRAEGIDARLPTGGSFLQHPYGAPYRVGQETPNADIIGRTGLFLGNRPGDMSEEIAAAVAVIKRYSDDPAVHRTFAAHGGRLAVLGLPKPEPATGRQRPDRL